MGRRLVPNSAVYPNTTRELLTLECARGQKWQLFMLPLELADFGVNRQLSSWEDDWYQIQPETQTNRRLRPAERREAPRGRAQPSEARRAETPPNLAGGAG
ncbi:hypothetical protein DdX_22467 [Ditylenchus destructor]|uniref:Uncharacterized protein n=1 Tax=Ditylenchus destructor TaxID=166010 RepID=A0AAD4QQW3_9BILA|nr:hypothetical protein DdX_22467 [Ditylenchus destructor]